MSILVTEAAATAIFTLTRILYDSVLGVVALILFSKLPGGSSAKFWYEQPDIVAKITSLFDPCGPTGKRGVRSTNAIAVGCLILTLALNIVPTILSKLSPISITTVPVETNSTLSPISNIFIPTLTDINLPHLSEPARSKQATNKFLCGYLPSGCNDAKNISIAEIVWDLIEIEKVAFHANNSLIVSINDTFATDTTPQQFISIAKNTFMANNYSTAAFRHAMSAIYYANTTAQDQEDITNPLNLLHADQFFPLATPDLSDLLKQGKRRGEGLPVNGSVDRAERWSAIHRTATLSTVLWQTVNAHTGVATSLYQDDCFLCQLIGIAPAQAATLQQELTTSAYAVQTSVDANYRLSTVLCLLRPTDSSTQQQQQQQQQTSYWCLHTYTQLWNVYHEHNPYVFFGSYDDSAWGAEQTSQLTSTTPFPFFPPPPDLETNRTYVPIVPIFEIRSKGQCSSDWNFRNQTVQAWMQECIYNDLGQVTIDELSVIAKNIWQLGSTITVGGFLVTAKYNSHSVGIAIGLAAQIIIGASIVLCIAGNLLLNLVTSAVHRRSLYEVIRVMVPTSLDPYKEMGKIAPTNTLRLADSAFDKDISYLKLNNRMIVTLSEYQETLLSRRDMSKDEMQDQDWSRRQLLNF
ncbi:hypothetical protein [Parasitella parasitica]|uniref:Uncharacterized protein n=1 Tax=Parasitella parasitica TaxID=35722 RepID=A0A0B7N5C4_9FUNG|nr:hypothetical protein [Parasitella parasitica]